MIEPLRAQVIALSPQEREREARTEEQPMDFDYVIVGGGSAGCVLAGGSVRTPTPAYA